MKTKDSKLPVNPETIEKTEISGHLPASTEKPEGATGNDNYIDEYDQYCPWEL